jgi:hypothetical protein
MKKIILLIIYILLLTGISYSQGGGEKHREIREKIEQLEKIKLIETLKMDEQTTLKFFARRTKFMDKIKELNNNQDDMIAKLGDAIESKDKDDSYYQSMIDKYFDYEQKISEAKKSFMNSLTDILSEEQIAKLIVFQKKFRDEIKDILFKRGNPPPGH